MCVSFLIIALASGFRLIAPLPTIGRKIKRGDVNVRGASHLFQRQTLAVFDVVIPRKTLTNPSAKQPGEERCVKMAMNASPSPTFIMIQAQFLLILAKTVFDGPSPERDAKELAKRPAVAAA